jgi:hypothetical protein
MKNDELARAAGFRVETRDGRVGSVAAVLPRADREVTGVLLVHTGLLSCKLTAVPFDEVESIDVDAQSVVLRDVRQAAPPTRRSHPRRSSSVPQTTRGKTRRRARSVARREAVPKTR